MLTSCATKHSDDITDFNVELFPSFPNPYNENNELVYFLTANGGFDKIINRAGDTEKVVLNGNMYYIVMPDWYWKYIEDFYTDYLYAVKTLKLYYKEGEK